MKETILSQLDNPGQLEQLYRANKLTFRQAFRGLYPELKGNLLAECWHERLAGETDEINWGASREVLVVLVVSLIAGLTAKLPALVGIDEEFFYPRNLSFILSPALIAYFSWLNNVPLKKTIGLAAATLGCIVFINSLPVATKSDTLILSCLHIVLVQWALVGISFVSNEGAGRDALGYLKFNGDLVVITTLIGIAGAILTGLTIGLFSLIGLDIHTFYFNYVAIFGLSAAPILGTYLTRNNPSLVGRVSPVIAKIFSPLVLIMLLVYLISMVYAGKDPYKDREFLLIFNALLVGVLALVFFSISEMSDSAKNQLEIGVIFGLSVLAILINGVALSAILFRISEWGFTPNRTVVLGSNVLILVNIILVSNQLYKALTRKSDLNRVAKSITGYLPVYFVWALIVTFLLPFVFGFK